MTPSELLINAEETTIKVIFSYLSRLNFNFEEIVHEDLPLRYTRSRVVAAQLVAGWGVALLQAIPKTPAVVRQLPLHELETMKIRTKKQWKIIHHRTCYAKCVCHWVKSVLWRWKNKKYVVTFDQNTSKQQLYTKDHWMTWISTTMSVKCSHYCHIDETLVFLQNPDICMY